MPGCSGCYTSTSCLCSYCAPDSDEAYEPRSPYTWFTILSGFSDGVFAPYSVFNGLWNLRFQPTRINNCVWVAETALVLIRIVGDADGDAFTVELQHRPSGCTITYTISGSFDCQSNNTFATPTNSCGDAVLSFAPSSIILQPGPLLVDCCFKEPGDFPPDTLYLTVTNVANGLCVTGGFPLTLDESGTEARAYYYYEGDTDTAIELVCGGESGRYWNLMATINGCRLDRQSSCTGVLVTEDHDSSYTPFVLRYSGLLVYPRFGTGCCAPLGEDCTIDNPTLVNAVVTT